MITIRTKREKRVVKGAYVNEDLYVTVEKVGAQISLVFIGPRDKYKIIMDSPERDITHIDSELIDEVIKHEQIRKRKSQYRKEKRAGKENKILAAAARQIYRVNPRGDS